MTFRAQWTKPGGIGPEFHDFAYSQPAEEWAAMCRAAGYEWVRVDEIDGDGAQEGGNVPVSEREAGNGPGDAGTCIRPADRRTATQEGK